MQSRGHGRLDPSQAGHLPSLFKPSSTFQGVFVLVLDKPGLLSDWGFTALLPVVKGCLPHSDAESSPAGPPCWTIF